MKLTRYKHIRLYEDNALSRREKDLYMTYIRAVSLDSSIVTAKSFCKEYKFRKFILYDFTVIEPYEYTWLKETPVVLAPECQSLSTFYDICLTHIDDPTDEYWFKCDVEYGWKFFLEPIDDALKI